MKISSFVPIHNRSSYSLLRGCLNPVDIVEQASLAGFSAVGMVDINNFYGMVRFRSSARNFCIKPLSGVAIVPPSGPRFTALCLTRQGFGRANELVTAVLREGPWDPVNDLLEKGWKGLYILSEDRDFLSRLRERGSSNLYTALFHGKPFHRLALWGRKAGIPPMALNDAVCKTRRDQQLFKILRAIDLNTTVDTLDPGELLRPEHEMVEADAMERFFSAIPEALENGMKFARQAEQFLLPQHYVFPAFQGLTEPEAFRQLQGLCIEGVRRRYGQVRGDIQKRLEYELSIIRRKGFSSYFLVVHNIVRRFPRTCGRGSSASSIVAYLLGITHVDPLTSNLFFERFLNMGRMDPPDIDVDFPWDEREQALRYVFKTYPGASAMVADHVTFGPRSSLREPARAFGFEEEEINALQRQRSMGRWERVPPYLRWAAARLRGMVRHIGTHPGGVVITPGKITDYTHIQTSPLGFPVIAWEKDGAEEAGLVKIDLLGNRSLGVLRDTIALVNHRHESGNPAEEGERGADGPISWENFHPLKDAATRELIEAGDTLGVFYVESPATRQLLRKMGVGDYEHLVIASSIIRPAANAYINEFVRRLHSAPYDPLHPTVAETLKETYGIMVYQEDVSRVAIDSCGFTPEEADGLRKILSKKDRQTKVEKYREQFFQKGLKQGLSGRVLRTLWDGIRSFEGYSFCKAHSASYALVSYKCAWLKRYYPLEFLVSVINNGGGFYSRQVYLNAVRRMGFTILGPCVNRSDRRFTACGGALRVGLSQLREVSASYIQRLLDEREIHGPFTSFRDLIVRTEPGFGDIRIIVRSGAADSSAGGLTRPQMLWSYFHRSREEDLFGGPGVPDCIGDYDLKVMLADEVKTMDLLISCHPLEFYENRIRQVLKGGDIPTRISSGHIHEYPGRRISIGGTLVTEKEVLTKKRKMMSFVSFEDPEGIFETVVFPDVYNRLLERLYTGYGFLVIGKVEEKFGVYQIQVDDVVPLDKGAVSFGQHNRWYMPAYRVSQITLTDN